jgi:hypothetical protein
MPLSWEIPEMEKKILLRAGRMIESLLICAGPRPNFDVYAAFFNSLLTG